MRDLFFERFTFFSSLFFSISFLNSLLHLNTLNSCDLPYSHFHRVYVYFYCMSPEFHKFYCIRLQTTFFPKFRSITFFLFPSDNYISLHVSIFYRVLQKSSCLIVVNNNKQVWGKGLTATIYIGLLDLLKFIFSFRPVFYWE